MKKLIVTLLLICLAKPSFADREDAMFILAVGAGGLALLIAIGFIPTTPATPQDQAIIMEMYKKNEQDNQMKKLLKQQEETKKLLEEIKRKQQYGY